MTDFVNSTSLFGYVDFVKALDGDAEELLNTVGINPKGLALPEYPVPYEKFVELLQLTSQRLQSPCFALELGKFEYATALGLVGLLAEKSPDLRTALNHVQHYSKVFTRGAEISFVEVDPLVIIQINIASTHLICRQSIDVVMGVMITTLKSILGNAWSPNMVYLEHSGEGCEKEYNKFFNCKIRYNHQYSAITFDAKLLRKTLDSADAQVEKYLLAVLDSLPQMSSSDVIDQVRRLIIKQMGNTDISLATIAEQFSLTPRALQYKLSKHGLTFFDLLDGIRSDIASKHLENSDISLSELFSKLGYSDQAAFNRSFKRWFGMTPSAWKKSKKT